MTARPSELVGVYRLVGRAAVTYFRLTLELDGRAVVERWRDFGGAWQRDLTGTWCVTDDRVHVADEQPHRVWKPFASGLHVVRSGGATRLVPDDELTSTDSREQYVKEPLPWAALCVDPDRFGHALTAGRAYVIIEEDLAHARVRVRGDHRRMRWFPRACFSRH